MNQQKNQDNKIKETQKEKSVNLNIDKILSAVMFIVLIWLAVWGTDLAVNFIKDLF